MRKLVASASLSLGLVSIPAMAQNDVYLLLTVDADCAPSTDSKQLEDALTLRLPGTDVRRDNTGTTNPTWTVTWRKAPLPNDPKRCVLDFASTDYTSSMVLPPKSSDQEITLAASRIAWLAGIDVPTTPVSVDEPDVAPPAGEEPSKPAEEERGPDDEPDQPEEPAEPKSEDPADKPQPSPEPPNPGVEKGPQVETSVVPWKLSFLPSSALVADHPPSKKVIPRFSANLLAGQSDGLQGVEIGLGVNIQRGDVEGVQFAIGGNIADRVDGVQLAAGFNSAGDDSLLFQTAVLNLSHGRGSGVQLGAANVNTESFGGVQVGAFNYAGNVRGLQLSMVNVGRKVDGVQVGLINVAKTSDVSLGLVNVLWGEPLYVTAFATTGQGIYAGVQHGGKLLRYGLFFGTLVHDDTLLELGASIGIHVGGRLFWDTDAMLFRGTVAGESFERGSIHAVLKTAIGYQIFPRLAVFAGVDGNLVWTGDQNPRRFLPGSADFREEDDRGRRVFVWPGVHLGVRF